MLPSLDPARGGPVTAVVELVHAMADAGVAAAIAAPKHQVAHATDVDVHPCRAVPTPFGPLVRVRRGPAGTRILHVHGIAALTPWSGYWPRRWNGPVVATMHGTLDWRLRQGVRGLKALWHRRLDIPLLRRFDAIHVTRPSEAEALARVGVPSGRSTQIPWTLRDEPPLAREGFSEPPYVAFIGRLHPIKGIERLLEAFAVLSGQHPSVRLRLAGTGPVGAGAALRARARELRIEDRLDVLGLVSRPALRRLLTDAAVLALPSLYENFGMVVLEALREGCPVVASRETPWEHVGPAGAGRWVDFAATATAAQALAENLEPRHRGDTGRAARRMFLEQYAPTSVAPRFLAWYESVVRAWRAGAAA